ncbi:MAG: DNA polymerase III subunit epsilon [Octadecabacter sp.]|nr:DNA polymerase III subunit epsilon [Octadecabacter sp.]
MREIVLDTETTGFEPSEGDRIVEIGAIELQNHMPTGRTYHQYINPKRTMPAGAFGIHGIGPDLLDPPQKPTVGQVVLRDKPIFADIAQAFVDFIGDAKLVIHNAAFDMKFLNAELKWVNRPLLPMDQSLDTLGIARKKFPGSPASLDALCRRFGINNSNRTLHGALLDSEILAEVYLELIGGRQPNLVMAGQSNPESKTKTGVQWRPQPRETPLAPKIKVAEGNAHATFIKSLGDNALWNKL